MSENSSKNIENLIIVGAGPAGLTAGIYAARGNLSPLIIKGFSGGQLTQTPSIENFPGFEAISGMDLVDKIENQAKNLGAKFTTDDITEVDFSKTPLELKSYDKTYYAKAIIIATGSAPKKLGIPSEDAFLGLGVSYCATCDGAFYQGQDVAVIGGGNSALVEATYLSNIANKVYLVHRRQGFRAEQAVINKVLEKVKVGKIELVLDATVKDILGDKNMGVNTLVLNTKSGEQNLKVSGVFVAIGHNPMSAPFLKYIETKNGVITTGLNNLKTQTNIPGVFACGDCSDDKYRQAVISAGTGAMAAIDAIEYLEGTI